ncbi:MAG: BTAD domain-containing putative transcriptional regulator [Aliishimia sp.]
MKNFDPDFSSSTFDEPTKAPSLHLNIFGPLSATLGTSKEKLELAQSGRELLGCLALHAYGTPLRRERLAEMLWPGIDPDLSRRRLRTGLWRLRKAMGSTHQNIITQNSEHIWLAFDTTARPAAHEVFRCRVETHCQTPPVEMRLEAFDDLTTLLNTYSGPLMDGIDASWVQPDREQFADLYLRGLDCQLKWYRSNGQAEDSICTAKQMLKLDPYREDVHAMLIGLYAAAGQPRRAIAQYHDCDGVLQDDLGIEATQARNALHDALLKRQALQSPTHKTPTELEHVLVGLQHSVRALSAQVDALRAALTDR